MTNVEALVSAGYLRSIVERLESFRSSLLGFRVAGTPEERQLTAFIAGEFRDLGLTDVVEEPVPVDAWRFCEAWVEAGGRQFECASMAGVPETPPGGIEGELVAVRRGGRREVDGVDVNGKVVLVDWSDNRLWPAQFGLELSLRGVLALIVTCGSGGPWFQAEGALGTFDAMWHPESCPMVTIRKEDAALLEPGTRVRVVLRAPLTRRAEAANVVGLLPGRRRGAPLLVAGHHDGWFSGAFDDATGVAATLALARAYVEAGVRPQHPIAFSTHTAEEYGLAWSRYDWCVGAWYQITATHRDWAARTPFYLNIEGSGLPYRLRADPPPELTAWLRRILRRAARDGFLPHGFALSAPSTFTEVWPLLAAGVPGINVSTFEQNWYRTAYHTQLDTSAHVDFEYLAGLTRVYARLLGGADEGAAAILDYRARAIHLGRRLRGVEASPAGERLLSSLDHHLPATNGRAPFTWLGRGLHGLDAHGAAAYPHEQTAADVAALAAGLREIRAGRAGRAAERLARVGLNGLCAELSEKAFALEHGRSGGDHPRATWAALGRPDPGPNLWRELASLRGEPGARTPGPWLERSLERHLARSRRELEARLARMASAVEGKPLRLPRGRYPE